MICQSHRPLVSFVVPVYNGERFLPECIRSAQEQTYEPIEIVIVDDGSSDSTALIASRFASDDGRVRVHRQRNQGPAGSLNAGLARARGDLVAILDHDDLAAPGRLAAQVPVLMDHPDIAVVGGAVDMVDERGRRFLTVTYPLTVEETRERLTSASPIVHSAATIRRSVLAELGGYREIFDVALDLDLWLRIAERHAIVNVPEVVAAYRFRPGQNSSDVERSAYQTVVARASAKARRSGEVDPAPEMLRPGGTLRPDENLLARQVVRYGMWYGRMLAKSGSRRAASRIFDVCGRAALGTGDPALVEAVAKARAHAGLTRLRLAKAAARRVLRLRRAQPGRDASGFRQR